MGGSEWNRIESSGLDRIGRELRMHTIRYRVFVNKLKLTKRSAGEHWLVALVEADGKPDGGPRSLGLIKIDDANWMI